MTIGSDVLTTYKADTSDHKAALADLKGSEQALQAQELEAAEARNQQLEDWVGGLAKVAVGITAAAGIASTAWDGYKDGLQESRLETSAAGVDIDALSESFGGLATKMQVLTFANAALHSSFGVTQDQMETAAGAIQALTDRGYDQAAATDAVTNALVTGRTRGLEPFGIHIDKNTSSLEQLDEATMTTDQRHQMFGKTLEALAGLAKQAGDGQTAMGDDGAKAVVKLKDAWDELKISLGQLVEQMGPFISGLAKIVSLSGGILDAVISITPIGMIADAKKKEKEENAQKLGNANAQLGMNDFLDKTAGSGDESIDAQNAAEQAGTDKLRDAMVQAIVKNLLKITNDVAQPDVDNYKWDAKPENKQALQDAQDAAARALLHGASMEADRNFAQPIDNSYGAVQKRGAVASSVDQLGPGGVAGIAQSDQQFDEFGKNVTSSGLSDAISANVKAQSDALAKQRAADETFLKKIFGPVGDFDLYKKGFEMLTGAVKASLDAWIDGSESASVAFNKFIGNALKGLADQMAIEALKELAYSIASLAMYDYSGAATHAEAAAMFTAGTIVAAIAAKEYGSATGAFSTGSSSGAGAAPTPQSSSTSSPSTDTGTTDRIIVYGDSYADDSPRMRQLKAKKMIATALGSTGVVNS